MLKTILTLKTRTTSVLGAQVYGQHVQQSKPINKSVLGACIYKKEFDNSNRGTTNNDTESSQKSFNKD